METTIMRNAMTLVLICLALTGCARRAERDPAEYHTVAPDLRRDSALARRENDRAVALIRQGRLDAAETLLRKALAADSTFGPARNNLGKVYFHQRKMYLAAWEFQHAIKLMPDHPEPRNNLGLVFEAAGKLDDAVQRYGEALQLDRGNPQLIGNLARARLRRGDSGEEVRDLLEEVVLKDIRPDWVTWAKEKLVALPAPAWETETP
jgi:Tfp pilus assembly protein PilF